jgi:hypothetical protein
MPELGQPLARPGRRPHPELRARIRRRFQDPRHEENGRRGVVFGLYILESLCKLILTIRRIVRDGIAIF